MRIPRRLAHIWIGPKPPPLHWMQSWKEMHPAWDYTLYGNDFLTREPFRTQVQIDEYLRRGRYGGVADLMRYEILYRVGGCIAEADSTCLHPVDELLEDDAEIYTVYENEFVRGKLVSPIFASVPGHPFLDLLISELSRVPPDCLDEPWKQTGNLYLAQMIEAHQPEITIWPSHFLNPDHYTGLRYSGAGKVYAHQKFGTTTHAYGKASLLDRVRGRFRRRYNRKRMAGLAEARSRHGIG